MRKPVPGPLSPNWSQEFARLAVEQPQLPHVPGVSTDPTHTAPPAAPPLDWEADLEKERAEFIEAVIELRDGLRKAGLDGTPRMAEQSPEAGSEAAPSHLVGLTITGMVPPPSVPKAEGNAVSIRTLWEIADRREEKGRREGVEEGRREGLEEGSLGKTLKKDVGFLLQLLSENTRVTKAKTTFMREIMRRDNVSEIRALDRYKDAWKWIRDHKKNATSM
jgi:hypothetical protein